MLRARRSPLSVPHSVPFVDHHVLIVLHTLRLPSLPSLARSGVPDIRFRVSPRQDIFSFNDPQLHDDPALLLELTSKMEVTQEELATTDSIATRALKDITFGSVAGITSKFFEHPFDLTKVRLQSQVLDAQARFSGPLDCLLQTWRKEGVAGLYRVRLISHLLWLSRVFAEAHEVCWESAHALHSIM